MFTQTNSMGTTWAPSASADQPRHVEDAAQVALWTVFDNNGANSFEIVFDNEDCSDTFDIFLDEQDDQVSVPIEDAVSTPWYRTI